MPTCFVRSLLSTSKGDERRRRATGCRFVQRKRLGLDGGSGREIASNAFSVREFEDPRIRIQINPHLTQGRLCRERTAFQSTSRPKRRGKPMMNAMFSATVIQSIRPRS